MKNTMRYAGQMTCENNTVLIVESINDFLTKNEIDFRVQEICISIGQINNDKEENNVTIVFNTLIK